MILVALLSLAAGFGASNPALFAGGLPPALPVDQVMDFGPYAVGYSYAHGDPLWSAQVETPASIAQAKKTARNGTFKACPALDPAHQISPAVYARSGYDIGHMTESASVDDKPLTFVLCNAVPQRPNLNRLVWAGIEQSLRDLAASGDTLYIITGPCGGWTGKSLGGRVDVPLKTCKAVYDVTRQAAGAWSCTNTQIPMPVCAQETIDAVAGEMGGDPLPGVTKAVKAAPWTLPPPTKGEP